MIVRGYGEYQLSSIDRKPLSLDRHYSFVLAPVGLNKTQNRNPNSQIESYNQIAEGQNLMINAFKTLWYRSKPRVFVSKPLKVTDNKKDTSLLRNLSIFCTLLICCIL